MSRLGKLLYDEPNMRVETSTNDSAHVFLTFRQEGMASVEVRMSETMALTLARGLREAGIK